MRSLLVLSLAVLLFVACGAEDAPGGAATSTAVPVQTATTVAKLPRDFSKASAPAAQPTAGESTATMTLPTAIPSLPTATTSPTETASSPTREPAATDVPTESPTKEPRVRKQYSQPPKMQIDPNKSYTATIETSLGTMVAQLDPKQAPKTVNNFVFLAREGYYDGVIFHRVIPGFVIQGGDPTGTGRGGPGYQFEDERVQTPYQTGSLAMANAGPNTNGSQFFVVLQGGAGALQPLYNHFGKITKGQDVLDAIAAVPLGPGNPGELSRPQQPVTIETITIEEK